MYTNILVPIDPADHELAGPAITAATTLARAGDGRIRLIGVMPATPAMLAEYVPADFEPQQRSGVETLLRQIAAGIDLPADRISRVVRLGGVYHEILQEAEAMGADLIVMRSHRPAMRTYLLGSNAAHVVRHAVCSVLVVRQ